MCRFISFTKGVILPFVVIAAIYLLVINSLWESQCNNYQTVVTKTTKYVWFDTCYVETEAGFQKWYEYHARTIEHEKTKHK